MIKSYLAPLGRLMTCLTGFSVLTIVFILWRVAGVAILRRALIVPIDMTLLARHGCMRPGQWEGRTAVIVGDFAPFGRLVTLSAVRPQLPLVVILRRVAGITILGRTFIDAIDMALLAGDGGVRPGQREGGLAVIVGNLAPLGRLVTLSAVRSQLSLMVVLRRVAGVTILGRTFIDAVDMALLAGDSRMRPGQWEGGTAVIVEYIHPLGRLMALSTVRPELSLVIILCRVAGITILRCSLEHSILMTSQAGNGLMGVSQREGGLVMVKSGLDPLGRLMT